MNEDTWASARTLEELFASGYGAVATRKLLLLASGWVRAAGLGSDDPAREVVDLAEACADGAPDPKRVEALVRRFGVRLPTNWPDRDGGPYPNSDWWRYSESQWHEALGFLAAVVEDVARARPVRIPWRSVLWRVHDGLIARRTREAIPAATAACAAPDHPWHRFVRTVPQETAARFGREHLVLARCVLGHPVRSVTCSSDWRTDTVLALARTVYESRDFSAMPILADALQDAGCDNDDVLGHCRAPGEHVRGCWVVDLFSQS